MVDSGKTLEQLFLSDAAGPLAEFAVGRWCWHLGKDEFSLTRSFAQKLLGDTGCGTIESFRSRLDQGGQASFDTLVMEHIESGEAFSFDHRLKLASGSWCWFTTRAVAARSGRFGAPLLLGESRDIDRLMTRVVAAEEARDQSDQANRLKTEFLTNISHELRTPLNGVLGMAQLLERTVTDERQKGYVERLTASGDALHSIIDDVLDLSRIEAGQMVLDSEALDPGRMMREVADAAAGLASQKGIALRVVLDPELETAGPFRGDRKRINQVVLNLVGNALKFTEQGSVTIKAVADPRGIRFSVTDTGPGVAAEHHEAIFRRFQQADGSATRKHGGTGLGLAISKEIIEAMGGSIGVESSLGAGATFWFNVPIYVGSAIPLHGNLAQGPFETSTSDIGPCSVLLAEDNPVNQEVVSEVLDLSGSFELTVVANGEEALKALEESRFDIVLMDVNMPVMTGDEAVRKLRGGGGPMRDVPVIMLTANALSEQRQYYLDSGANAYLAKPVNADELLSEISRLVCGRKISAA